MKIGKINRLMLENKDNKDIPEKNKKRPDESAGFYFSSFIKIVDPNNKEVLLQKRGDD
jgi:hypothetical protein